MKVAVCYVFPNLMLGKHIASARRFLKSWMAYPPGELDHKLWILVNGGQMAPNTRKVFDALPCQFLYHSNQGKDIGAFQKAAEVIDCDLLVCFGAYVHFCFAGWLDRIVSVMEQYGPHLYGAWGFHLPRPHIRTTAFWLPRDLLRAYPLQITDPFRYEFEHGRTSLTLYVQGLGLETMMVSRQDVFPTKQWRHLPKEECLLLDQHTDRIGYG